MWRGNSVECCCFPIQAGALSCCETVASSYQASFFWFLCFPSPSRLHCWWHEKMHNHIKLWQKKPIYAEAGIGSERRGEEKNPALLRSSTFKRISAQKWAMSKPLQTRMSLLSVCSLNKQAATLKLRCMFYRSLFRHRPAFSCRKTPWNPYRVSLFRRPLAPSFCARRGIRANRMTYVGRSRNQCRKKNIQLEWCTFYHAYHRLIFLGRIAPWDSKKINVWKVSSLAFFVICEREAPQQIIFRYISAYFVYNLKSDANDSRHGQRDAGDRARASLASC